MAEKRVTGLGGVFFRAKNPKELGEWYRDRLGLNIEPWGGSVFHWREKEDAERPGSTVWSPFKESTEYFGRQSQQWMINYRVENMDAVLEALKAEGVEVIDRKEEPGMGIFAWIVDPEGNRIELWQPEEGS